MACRLDTVECMIEDSDERTLPRARELWRSVTWRAEREHPDTWGQKGQNITINNNIIAIGDSLIGEACELLEKLRVVNAISGENP